MSDINRPLRVALIAGEASGDMLAASLMRQLKQLHPDIEFAGVGGSAMSAEGLCAWADSSELAVMGLTEVISHLPRLLRLRSRLKSRLQEWQPDIFIGVDAPDFNLAIERWLKRRGTATVHYVSPSVWAWRESRAAKMRANADLVLCLFPMEPEIYQRHQVRAVFVGHPQATRFALSPNQAESRVALGVDGSARCLAILPGSRRSEIQKLLPEFLSTFALLKQTMPQLRALIPAANTQCRKEIDHQLQQFGDVNSLADCSVIDGQSEHVLVASDAVLLASGTAALEAMLAKRPMVVGYRINRFSHWLVKRFNLLKTVYVSLPNVLAKQMLVSECLQDECTAENLAHNLQQIFDNHDRHGALISRFKEIHLNLLPPSKFVAAKAVLDLLPR